MCPTSLVSTHARMAELADAPDSIVSAMAIRVTQGETLVCMCLKSENGLPVNRASGRSKIKLIYEELRGVGGIHYRGHRIESS